jgi:hypothetical protein
LWDEETKPGNVILEVKVARFLDSSLIDVDIHPSYLSVVIKGKVLRLRLPAEVKVSESKCQRSKTTGSLVVIMPKVSDGQMVPGAATCLVMPIGFHPPSLLGSLMFNNYACIILLVSGQSQGECCYH